MNNVTSKLGFPLQQEDYNAHANVLTIGVGYRF